MTARTRGSARRLATTWHTTRRLGRPRVPLRAGELALQVGEGVGDFRSFERAVASPDADLAKDSRVDESGHGFVGLDETPTDHLSSTVDGDDRRPDESAQEEVGG